MSTGAHRREGYRDRPVLKPPVWTWEVPVYLFVGGAAGMAVLIAAAARLGADAAGRTAEVESLVRTALWIGCAGAVLSPPLLISDLGRPLRFLHMLRRFNRRSAMSMGVWILVTFSALVTASLVLDGALEPWLPGLVPAWAQGVAPLVLALAGLSGGLLATYTGVLLAATVIPAWNRRRRTLPVHLGAASLGAAAGLLVLAGETSPALGRILWGVIAVELALWLVHRRRHDGADGAPVRFAATPLAVATLLLTVVPAVALAAGSIHAAALAMVLGSLASRFGWIRAGRESALASTAERLEEEGGAGRRTAGRR